MGTPTPDRQRTAGIVLAGGLSSRMGRDKALLRWQGQTLLERSIGLLQQAGADPVRVSGDYPAHGGIPDRIAQRGPLGGLYSVLLTLDDGWVWVVPVDMPLLDVAALHQLCDAAPAMCVRFTGQPLPMLLYNDQSCRILLAHTLHGTNGPRSLHRFQQELGLHEVAIAAGAAGRLVNCNTPGQWKDAVT